MAGEAMGGGTRHLMISLVCAAGVRLGRAPFVLQRPLCYRALQAVTASGDGEEPGMEYRRLGHSGLQVSVIGLGTNNFGPRIDYPAAERVLHQAVEEGINFIETSNTYGDGQAETFIGKALHAKRDQVLFATKVVSNRGEGPNMHGGSRKHILAQVELSLRRLHSDYMESIKSITTIPTHAWKKPCAPWTRWCTRARCATLGVPTLPPGRWPRPWALPEPWASSHW